MRGTVIIDYLPESAERYRNKYAIVVVDVIRSMTTAITAVSMGWRVYPARTTDDAFVIAATLHDPLLVGEMGGNMPYGFDLTNSPYHISKRIDIHRPMVLLSSSGTELLLNAAGSKAVYCLCFRNLSAVAGHINGRHEHIAILGAGTRGQFRREDQMGCAWVAQKLVEAGYSPETRQTTECISRWNGINPDEAQHGKSADYLRQSNQLHDLTFILSHIDDLDVVTHLVKGEIIPAPDQRKAVHA